MTVVSVGVLNGTLQRPVDVTLLLDEVLALGEQIIIVEFSREGEDVGAKSHFLLQVLTLASQNCKWI